MVLPRMGTAAVYSVMAGSTITNTGTTVITGSIALSPGSAVTGFPPGSVSAFTDISNGPANQAQVDLVQAYTDAQMASPAVDKSGVDLGTLILTPGAYRFTSSAQLTGTLTLDGQGNANSLFIIQVGSDLTTASASIVALVNGANSCNVFWQITRSATLGTGTSFQGTLIALTSITMTTRATIGVGGGVNGGRALARNGAVTLDTNRIIPPAGCTPAHAAVPAPSPSATRQPGLPNSGAPPAAGPPPPPWLPIFVAVLVGGILTASFTWGRRRRS